MNRATCIITTLLAFGGVRLDPLTAQTPRELLDSVMTAYGGREALAGVHAYEMRGTVESLVRGGQAGTIRTFARPASLRVVMHYSQRVEVRVVDGERGWRGDQNGMVTASGPMLDAMRLQAARAAVPWILDEHRDELHPIASLDIDGITHLGIALDLGNGLTLRAYVDPATYHVVRVQTALSTPTLSVFFETRYTQFRAVDGVLFAFAEENFASGTHTGSTRLEQVVVNPPVEAAAFSPRGERE